MGIIKPPWISREWFEKFPFNFCDHFGDQALLATKCKICKQELARKIEYEQQGVDPYDMQNIYQDLAENFTNVKNMLTEDMERMGIDPDDLSEIPDLEPPKESFPIAKLVSKYCKQVGKLLEKLEEIPLDQHDENLQNCLAALAHSRLYALVKIYRALHSLQDQDDQTQDSKTSAFLAYIALERNSRALMALAKYNRLAFMKAWLLEFAMVTIEVAEGVQSLFFPDEELVYEEFGSVEF